jgi:hypothetical protein
MGSYKIKFITKNLYHLVLKILLRPFVSVHQIYTVTSKVPGEERHVSNSVALKKFLDANAETFWRPPCKT